MMIAGIERAAAIGPIAVGGVIAWIFIRRMMVRSIIGRRRDRDSSAPIPYDPELEREGFSTPRQKEKATRRQLKYARQVLDEDEPPKPGV